MNLFITATGTNIGKTLITTAICYQMLSRKLKLRAIKPVITGWNKSDNDTRYIIESQNLDYNEENIHKTSPWRFYAPLSPDIAAIMEGKTINFYDLVKFCQKKDDDVNIIEGAGGIMSPICVGWLNIDLAKRIKPDIILVTGTYLGSITHTLSAIEVIKNRNLNLKMIIINESVEDNISLIKTLKILKEYTDINMMTVPRICNSLEKWKKVPNIAII